MIAYHFPPVQVSSGLQRTLAFTRHLRSFGWESIVLSVSPTAYEVSGDGQIQDIPEGLEVKRTLAFDTARHLSIKGRYLDLLALPDRWVSWWFSAVWSGLRLIRSHRPEAIWATYPIATAFLIAYTLHRITGVPLVADFRDSMVDDVFPDGQRKRKIFRWIEKKVVYASSRVVFTSPGALKMYRERYPDVSEDRWLLIPNGYSEELFSDVESRKAKQGVAADGPVRILHSGVVYPLERDPSIFFSALAELKREGVISAARVRVMFRASGHDELYYSALKQVGIEDVVELLPSIAYRDALDEILSVDGLLVLQASNCNHQIPAKIYEYLRAGKPILALTDAEGDTARVLVEAGVNNITSLDNLQGIKKQLVEFVEAIEANSATLVERAHVERHSREHGAGVLAEALDSLP